MRCCLLQLPVGDYTDFVFLLFISNKVTLWNLSEACFHLLGSLRQFTGTDIYLAGEPLLRVKALSPAVSLSCISTQLAAQ